MSEEIQWAPVATAPDEVTAEMWVELLQNNGIPAWVGMGHVLAYRPVLARPSAVMVPATQLKDAGRILGVVGPRRRYRRRK
jgi:hypothetical protein